jgi:hypothetical protein
MQILFPRISEGGQMILRTFRWVSTAAVVAATLAACVPGRASFYQNALPEALGTTDILVLGSDASWFDMVLPIRREGCGAVVFRLSPETIAKIRQQGLAFFQDARQARGYDANSAKGRYYAYAAWQATPAPEGWFGDGAVAGSLSCAGVANDLIRKITEGGKGTEGYFTTKKRSAAYCAAAGTDRYLHLLRLAQPPSFHVPTFILGADATLPQASPTPQKVSGEGGFRLCKDIHPCG